MKDKIKQEKTKYSVERLEKHLDYFDKNSNLSKKLYFILNLTKKNLVITNV